MSTVSVPAVKPATTHKDQVELLKSRGLVISDEASATEILQKVNYYRLSAYLLPFKIAGTDNYTAGTSFDQIHNTYEFDRRFRGLIMSALEPIEILLRAHIAYYLGHTYGALCHEDPKNFTDPKRYAGFANELALTIQKNQNTLVVKHHQQNYGSHFPIWAAVELFSMGMLSRFYANLKRADQKSIAKDLSMGHTYLKSWLLSLSWLRNCCAHYDRLYYQFLTFSPLWPSKCTITPSKRVFDLLFIMKDLYPGKEAWNTSFVAPLSSLVGKYRNSIDLSYLGFPHGWKKLLRR